MGIPMNLISKIHQLNLSKALILFVILDVLCMGAGMGVPVFNIMLGFVVGWYIARRITLDTREFKLILQHLLVYSCVTACVTFLGMVLIWGWSILILFDSQTELVNFGIPMILYEPRASFIGWLCLMIVISPFLQLLTTVFAGHLTLLSISKKEKP
jgi:hypothetical protein